MIDSFHKSFRKILHSIMINHLQISILDYSWTHRKRKRTSNALLTSVCRAVTCTHTPWNDCLTRWLSLIELFIYSVTFILFYPFKRFNNVDQWWPPWRSTCSKTLDDVRNDNARTFVMRKSFNAHVVRDATAYIHVLTLHPKYSKDRAVSQTGFLIRLNDGREAALRLLLRLRLNHSFSEALRGRSTVFERNATDYNLSTTDAIFYRSPRNRSFRRSRMKVSIVMCPWYCSFFFKKSCVKYIYYVHYQLCYVCLLLLVWMYALSNLNSNKLFTRRLFRRKRKLPVHIRYRVFHVYLISGS